MIKMLQMKNYKYKHVLLASMLAGCIGFNITAAYAENSNANQAETSPIRMGQKLGEGRLGGHNERKETDAFVLKVMQENAPKFEQRTYTDADGRQLPFSIYSPANINKDEKVPLVMFIPDASATGKSAKEIVENYYGASAFVTEEMQAKHKAYVLVPAFPEVVVDDEFQTSAYIETAVSLLHALVEKYPIDAKHLYTTGQSMGCMTSLYLNSKYPDLFAASLFVGGQWDKKVLKPLMQAKFFYVTAGGDLKASGGQTEVMQLFKDNQVPYTYYQWSAQEERSDQFAHVASMLGNNTRANFIRFTEGSVLYEGQNMEHMASFKFAYKLSPVIDWLFAQ